jgi:CP12 domain
MSEIQEKIQEEIQSARAVCADPNSTSSDCAVAWDTVEEMQAEAAHQRQNAPQKSSLERYCDENPDAAECRLYED